MTDLRDVLDRKMWVQCREATYIAWRALEYLAGRPPTTSMPVAAAEARRALDMMRRVLGRGWDGRGVYLAEGEPPPGPEVYDHPGEHRKPGSYDEWMAARRAARVAVTGEARYARWERDLAARSFLRLLSGNETDEVLAVMTGLWQEATAPDGAVPG